jgi:hypothetical protein
LRGLHPRALVESPSSFRRLGVFITGGALSRARAVDGAAWRQGSAGGAFQFLVLSHFIVPYCGRSFSRHRSCCGPSR